MQLCTAALTKFDSRSFNEDLTPKSLLQHDLKLCSELPIVLLRVVMAIGWEWTFQNRWLIKWTHFWARMEWMSVARFTLWMQLETYSMQRITNSGRDGMLVSDANHFLEECSRSSRSVFQEIYQELCGAFLIPLRHIGRSDLSRASASKKSWTKKFRWFFPIIRVIMSNGILVMKAQI